VVAVSAITPCTEALFAPDDDDVIASVGDVEAAIRTTRGHKPDVFVMDLNMPGGSSLAAIPDDLLLVQYAATTAFMGHAPRLHHGHSPGAAKRDARTRLPL